MAVAAAMPNDALLLWPPTNLAPDTHAPATARKAMTAMTVLAVLRALAAWMMTPIAVTTSSVPSSAWRASVTGPLATARPNAVRSPAP